jgi:uncharacterized NAD-dependent epimerase/dehydratase family protein
MVVLAEGKFGVFTSKTAVCLIRYKPDEVTAVIDSTKAGKKASDFISIGEKIPIVSTVKESLQFSPNSLVIGIAPTGGGLPDSYRKYIFDAIEAGLDVISGLHTLLADDPEISAAAKSRKVKLFDVRRLPDSIPVGKNLAKNTNCLRVHTVGTDCNVGKMLVAYEVAAAARKAGWDAKFIATGQTGIMIEGDGIAVDRAVGDFISGVAEKLVLDNAHRELLVIEGQGTLIHPSYSGVTLSLLHGCAPQALIMCHHAGKKHIGNHPDIPIPPIPTMVKLYEYAASFVNPTKAIAVALNCADYDSTRAREEVDKVESQTGLPTTDVVKFGCEKIIGALERLRRSKNQSQGAQKRIGTVADKSL